MIGKVIGINSRKGLVAVDTTDGITIFELLGGYEINIGDTISGNLDTHEGETLYNKSQNEAIDVYIEAIHCSLEHAKEMLR